VRVRPERIASIGLRERAGRGVGGRRPVGDPSLGAADLISGPFPGSAATASPRPGGPPYGWLRPQRLATVREAPGPRRTGRPVRPVGASAAAPAVPQPRFEQIRPPPDFPRPPPML